MGKESNAPPSINVREHAKTITKLTAGGHPRSLGDFRTRKSKYNNSKIIYNIHINILFMYFI